MSSTLKKLSPRLPGLCKDRQHLCYQIKQGQGTSPSPHTLSRLSLSCSMWHHSGLSSPALCKTMLRCQPKKLPVTLHMHSFFAVRVTLAIQMQAKLGQFTSGPENNPLYLPSRSSQRNGKDIMCYCWPKSLIILHWWLSHRASTVLSTTVSPWLLQSKLLWAHIAVWTDSIPVPGTQCSHVPSWCAHSKTCIQNTHTMINCFSITQGLLNTFFFFNTSVKKNGIQEL